MATKKNEEIIEIKPLDIKTVSITIKGDTPLIMHAWSEKAKRMMLEAQQGKAKGKKRECKNPVADFVESIYWLYGKPVYSDGATEEEVTAAFVESIHNGARFGFPVTAIKQAACSAAYRLGWVKNQMGLRGAFFIESDFGDMVEIISDTPVMREDMVRVGMGTADLRYRGEFRNWSAKFRLKYNASGGFPLDSIINALNAGGFVCGIGECRPEKDGAFGTFHVATD